MIGYLYILQSEKNQRYYIGSTNNVDRRLLQHNAGYVAATRSKGPWKIAKITAFEEVKTARAAEQFLKRQKSARLIAMILDDTFVWPHEFGVR